MPSELFLIFELGGLIADQALAGVRSSNCGSELAREGFLSGGRVLSD